VPFLLARVSAKAIAERSLSWVVRGAGPWTAIDPVDLDAAMIEGVFEMYARVYGRIDDSLNVAHADGLFEFDRWILVEGAGGRLIGFVLAKTTPFGLKVGLTASDGSVRGREAIKAFHRRVYREMGVYGEVSDALELVVAGRAPRVSARVARLVLHPKLIHPEADGYHYGRDIARVGRRTKLMIGNPVLPSA